MKQLGRAIANYWHSTDRWMLLYWVAASGISIVLLCGIYNSGMLSSTRRIITQLIAAIMGAAAAIMLSLIDYHSIVKLWKFYLPACLIGVALTFIVGQVRGDNQAWLVLELGGLSLSLQPAEFLKIAFIMTFTLHIDLVKNELNRIQNVALLCLHGLAYVMLPQLQGDSGTGLVFLGIFLIMIFYAGLNWKYIAVGAASLVVLIPVLWFVIMTPDQKMRILTLFDPSLSEAYAYQQLRGKMALSRGGLQGTGIFKGQHLYIPEIYNDFIFAFLGESAGFMGCLGVIVLLFAICLRLLRTSHQAEDNSGRLLCVGVFGMFFVQMLINLGMCLGVLPVIGVTMPLISHGGTSVVALYLGLGLQLSVYTHSTKNIFSS
jgi:Bacterial cell division membrane protein